MAVTQTISAGQLVANTSTTAASASTTSSSNLDKDAFLQLLVAQMQYQDPLAPTDNTEYISQLATFSQLEATQNMQALQTSSFASSLVGKHVIINTTSLTGTTSYVNGVVDYVMYESGEVFLSVNDNLYPLDNLDTIVTNEYFDGTAQAGTFATMLSKLPSLSKLSLSDEAAVKEVREFYDSLTDSQKSFISEKNLETLTALEEKLKELQEAEGDTSEGTTENTSTTV